MQKRTLEELLNRDDPAWPLIINWMNEGKNKVEVLPAREPDRANALLEVQVTTRSPMGAIVYETGGMLVDHGWLRILGSGSDKMNRSLAGWNAEIGNNINSGDVPPFLLIADDVIGGFFALDNGFFGNPSRVFYFSPDSLDWEDTEKGYTDFLLWCFNADLTLFYSDYRWAGWENEVAELNGNQAFTVYPFPFADGPPIGQRSRGVAPVAELFGLYTGDLREQLGFE